MGKTLRNIVAGIMIPAAVAGSASLSGCEEKPAPAQNQVQKVEEKEITKELSDWIPIKIREEIFDLDNDGGGIYRGRLNKLIGSYVIEARYGLDSSIIKIKKEGSLFLPEENYFVFQKGFFQKGDYIARTPNGKELKIRLGYPYKIIEADIIKGLGKILGTFSGIPPSDKEMEEYTKERLE